MAILSETLRKYQNDQHIFTGEPNIDKTLAYTHDASDARRNPDSRGLPVNSFSEISGPPGSGKTAIWLSLALETLKRGMQVMYIGCNYTPFPFSRAEQLNGWNSSRFENRIVQLHPSSIEQMLIIELHYDLSKFGLIVFDHYDSLIKTTWDRQSRERASSTLIQKASELSQKACVVATCTSVKYRNEENCLLMAPATIEARLKPGANMVRLSLYKDPRGNSVLSTGTKFRIKADGLQSINPCDAESVPLHILSTKRKVTPQRRIDTHPLTPAHTGHKRRLSISTPSKSTKTVGRSNIIYPTDDKLRSSHELSSPSPISEDHLHRKPSFDRYYSTMPSSQPDPSGNQMANHPNSVCGGRVDDPLPRCMVGDSVMGEQAHGSPKHATSENSVQEFLGVQVIPNSQIEPGDPSYSVDSKNI